MLRFYPRFHDGWSAVGLFLVRAAVGGTAVVQGWAYLPLDNPVASWYRAVGLLTMLCGVAIVLGFLTPVTSVAAAAEAICTHAAWLSAPNPNLFNAGLPTILVVALAAAIVCLGPGTMSVDARLFGFRKVIIPRDQDSARVW